MFEELEIAVSESKVDTVAMLLSAVSANPADFLTTTTTTSSSYSSTPSTYVNTSLLPPLPLWYKQTDSTCVCCSSGYVFHGLDSDEEEVSTSTLTSSHLPPPPPSTSSTSSTRLPSSSPSPTVGMVVNQGLTGAPWRYDLGSLMSGSLLHLAVLRRSSDIVELLLEAGADPGGGKNAGVWTQGVLRAGRALVDRLVGEERYSGSPAELARHLGASGLARVLEEAELDAAARARVDGPDAARVRALEATLASVREASSAANASYKTTLAAWIGKTKELEEALAAERNARAALEADYAAQYAEAKAKLGAKFKAKVKELNLQLEVHKAQVDATIDDRVADARDRYAADNLALRAQVAEDAETIAGLRDTVARMRRAGATPAGSSLGPHAGPSLFAGLPAVPAYPHEASTLEVIAGIQHTVSLILSQGPLSSDYLQRGEDARALRHRIEPILPPVQALLPYRIRPITVQKIHRALAEIADLLQRAQTKAHGKLKAEDFALANSMLDAVMASFLEDVASLLGEASAIQLHHADLVPSSNADE